MNDQEEMYNRFYTEYLRLNGKSNKDDYMKHLEKFIELTMNSYVNGEGDTRAIAYGKWVNYIGNKVEANLYFCSVDNIAAYT